MKDKLSFQNIFWVLSIVFAFSILSYVIWNFLASVTMAIFLYYISRPLHIRVKKYVSNNTIAAGITLLSTFIPLILLSIYIIQIGLNELRSFLAQNNLWLQDVINSTFEFDVLLLLDTPRQIIESAEGVNIITELFNWSIAVTGIIGDIFLQFLITTVLYYGLLRHGSELRMWINSLCSPLISDWFLFVERVDEDLDSVYFGNIINGIFAMLVGILIALVYSLLAPAQVSINFPFLFGILVGIASLIPVIGVKIVYVPISVYFLFIAYSTQLSSSTFILIFGFIFVCAVFMDFLVDLLIRPYVSGKNLNIELLLVAYISGPILLGWYGFFFAPLVLIILHHFAKLILPDIVSTWSQSG